MLHAAGVPEVNTTGNPDVAVAVSVGVVPKVCTPGLAKVMLCTPFGVTGADDGDAALVPIVLVAVMKKRYATPLVSPVTVIGPPLPVAVRPPGCEVTV